MENDDDCCNAGGGECCKTDVDPSPDSAADARAIQESGCESACCSLNESRNEESTVSVGMKNAFESQGLSCCDDEEEDGCCGEKQKGMKIENNDQCCKEERSEQAREMVGNNAKKGNTCTGSEIPSACCPSESTKEVCFDKTSIETAKNTLSNEKNVQLTEKEANVKSIKCCCTDVKQTAKQKQRWAESRSIKTDKGFNDDRCNKTSSLLNKMGNKVTYGSFKCCDSDGDCGCNGCLLGCAQKSTQYMSVPCDNIDTDVTEEIEVLPVVKVMTTTKLRIQNICCGKEAELMKRELEPLNGIEAVSVNVVGRIGFVKHDTTVVSASDIVNTLNKLHLGVSIMESGQHDENEALNKEFKIKLGVKLLLLFVLFALFIVVIVGRVHKESWRKWVAIAVIVIGGVPILRKAILNWMKKIFVDINVLMLITVIGTVALHEWIEGATVVFVFAIAEVLQDYCTYRVQKAISGLMVHVPETAVLAETGKSVPVEEIDIGTIIAVCAGEKIALDGKVIKGQASVDESSITGESIPIEKSQGDIIYSGTIVQNGFLEIVTTSDSANSTVSKVTQLVQEAQGKASRTEKIMNKFAKIYTPLVLATALLIFAIPAILAEAKVGNYGDELHWWGIRALIVLLIACPCALVMSVPMPMVCGITAAARNGVLIKGGTHMEALAGINTVAFDKTGTLTEGRFKVINIQEIGATLNYNDILMMIAALEVKSSHPVASAIVNHYSGCITDKIANFGAGVGLPDVSNFKSLSGLGLTGIVNGYNVTVGNKKIMQRENVQLPHQAEAVYDEWSKRGQTVILAAVDSQLVLLIGLADTPRPTAKIAIRLLQDLKVNTIMLTGDSSGAARSVMNAVGTQSFVANMKPEEKLQWIRDHQNGDDKSWKRIAMIGDGVNDGPSLAAADVGIAIGACATALAIESAGVALMSDSMVRIPDLLVLSRFTKRVVWQNIFLALTIKIAVMIATLVGSLTLWMAVLSDVAALLLVILNGFRPLMWKRRTFKEADTFNYTINHVKDVDGDYEGIALIQIES